MLRITRNGVTYQSVTASPTTIRVSIEGRRVGTIYESAYGWVYAPKHSDAVSETFPTLALLQKSLEVG